MSATATATRHTTPVAEHLVPKQQRHNELVDKPQRSQEEDMELQELMDLLCGDEGDGEV